MIRIALQGSYFGHNFGDVLLLSLYRKWIKETIADCEVVLPQGSEDAIVHIGADIVGFKHLVGSHGLIYAGGGYFGEPPGSPAQIRRWSVRNLFRHMPSGSIATGLGRPVAVIGVGAGPLSSPMFRYILRWLVERAEIVAVRDEESRRFLHNIGVSRPDTEVTADAALSITIDDIPKEILTLIRSRFPTNNLVGVHLPSRPSFSSRVELVLNGLEMVLRQRQDLEIVVISDNVSYDPRPLATQLERRHLARVHVATYSDPWTLVALLSQLRLVITTKLHVGIVATAVGTLPLAFPFHHKTERFYRQIGRPELCTPLTRVDREGVARQLEQALHETQHEDYRYELPCSVREAARRNKQLVQRFLGIVLERVLPVSSSAGTT